MLIDTEEDNQAALIFFQTKHGFSQPIKHVYLDLNLDDMQKERKKQEEEEEEERKSHLVGTTTRAKARTKKQSSS